MKPMKMAFSCLLLVACTMVCFASTSHAKKERADTGPSITGGVGETYIFEGSSNIVDIYFGEICIVEAPAVPAIRYVKYRFENVAVSGAKKTFKGYPASTLARARTFDC